MYLQSTVKYQHFEKGSILVYRIMAKLNKTHTL